MAVCAAVLCGFDAYVFHQAWSASSWVRRNENSSSRKALFFMRSCICARGSVLGVAAGELCTATVPAMALAALVPAALTEVPTATAAAIAASAAPPIKATFHLFMLTPFLCCGVH